MFGKHFESTYDGSMYGAGFAFFAVWGYVIAHARNSRVELNPVKLAHTLGGPVEEVERAIKRMTEPDTKSRNKSHDGRKLIQEGEFQYWVTGYIKYQSIKNEDERREQNRLAQQRHRAAVKEMSPAERAEYESARGKEYAKRRKPGVRAVKRSGAIAGARSALRDGFAEQEQAAGGNGADLAPGVGNGPILRNENAL